MTTDLPNAFVSVTSFTSISAETHSSGVLPIAPVGELGKAAWRYGTHMRGVVEGRGGGGGCGVGKQRTHCMQSYTGCPKLGQGIEMVPHHSQFRSTKLSLNVLGARQVGVLPVRMGPLERRWSIELVARERVPH